jgi:hypothetical protein
MFFNQCQTTNSLELYNPNSKELLSNWEFKGKITKTFDKDLKCYTHTLDIGRLSKMSFPKSKCSLNIVQTYIVFQLYLYSTKNFFIEIDFTDTNNIKSRFLFSTNLKILTVNFFTSVIPIIQLPIGNWINLSIDILSFINSNFKNKKTFKKIDFISVSGSLKIRRIFSMRGKINENFMENSIEKINKNDKSYIKDEYGNSEVIPAKFLINNSNVKVVNVNMNAENVFNNNNNNNNNFVFNNNNNNNNFIFNNNNNILNSNLNNNIEFFNVNESKISYRNYSKEKENKNENENNNDNNNKNNDNNNNNNNNDNKIIFTTNNNNNLIDSSKKNKRYKLENRITNTNEPIQISTNTNISNIDGISNSISSSIVNNINKFNNNININTIESKQQINEMIQSKENENEFDFDDKGLIYISKNENKNIENDIKNLTQDMNIKNNNNNDNNNNNNNNNNDNNNNNLENSLKISQLKNNILKNNSIEKIATKQSTNSRPYSPPLSNSLNKKNTNN